MSALSKIAGAAAGLSAVAVLGVAIAQGQPPDARIPNHPIAAGQQSTHVTPMGETGVLTWPGEMRTAVITPQPEPVAAVQPAPAPEPVVVAQAEPAPAPQTTAMGAGPAPVEPAAPAPRVDRN
jgi:hypothetical protein